MNFLAPISTILFSTILVKKATGSWFSPGSFFSLSWSFFLIIPLVFAPEFQINDYGVWCIVLMVMACSAGSVFASFIVNKKMNYENKKTLLNNKRLVSVLVIFNLIVVFGLISLIVFANSIYSNIFTYNNWLSIPNLISIDRYSETLKYPFIITYSLYFIFPANIIAGILLSIDDNSLATKFFCYMPLLCAIALGLIEGARSGILLAFILFISSLLATRIRLYNGSLKLSATKIITIFLLFIVLFIFLFIVIQWLRQDLDPIIAGLILTRIKAYFFGYLSAFTLWFESLENIFSINNQISTFAGPMNLFGLIDRNLGFYNAIDISDSVSTNIYTALRGLISDFSFFGSLIMIFIIGFYFQLEFQKKKRSKFDGIIPISIFYSFTIYSPLISIFHYNSIFFSWVIVFFILKISIIK